jgi:hypothetical protein
MGGQKNIIPNKKIQMTPNLVCVIPMTSLPLNCFMGTKRVGLGLDSDRSVQQSPVGKGFIGGRLEMQNVRHMLDVSHHMPDSYEV